jgi:hypothetical protein
MSFFVFAILRQRNYCAFLVKACLLRERCSAMNQAKTSTMTSTRLDGPPSGAPISPAELNRWLLRAQPGQQLEYHGGHLVWDRSPASSLAEHDRRALARIADAAFQAAEQGQVHLVQRRNGPFDFSYLAIKPSRGAGAVAAPSDPLPILAAA